MFRPFVVQRTIDYDRLDLYCVISHCTLFNNHLSDFWHLGQHCPALCCRIRLICCYSIRITPYLSLNVIAKYADDTCRIIPASYYNTCQAEIQNVEQWANIKNLTNSIVPNHMKFYLLGRYLVAKLISHQLLSKPLQEFKWLRLWMSPFLNE